MNDLYMNSYPTLVDGYTQYYYDTENTRLLPAVNDTENAPYGYKPAPVFETRNDLLVAVYYAQTEEEQVIETLRIKRSELVVDAWQGRYILAGMAPITEGPLAAYIGTSVLAQTDQFVAANLPAPDQERYRGTKTWRRDDPMVTQLGGLLGLDDAQIDIWFESARAVN